MIEVEREITKTINTVTIPNDVSKSMRFDPSISQGSTSERQPPKSLTLDLIKRHIA